MKAFTLDAVWEPKPGYEVSAREKNDKRAIRGDMVYRNLKMGIQDVPEPKVGDDDVLMKVGACGICGSDMHAGVMAEDGYTAYAGHLKLPVILGHEYAGEVAEVGKNVKGIKPGDIITIEQMRPCGDCDACMMGYFNSCRNIEEIGLSMDGAFSEYTIVPKKDCYVVNDILEQYGDKQAAFEAAALAEPTGVAYNGLIVQGKGVTPGTHVAVFGTGPIGLAAISIARAAGAAHVFAVDISEERLKLAEKCGANYLLNPIELNNQGIGVTEAVIEYTKGAGCKTIVEAAGAPQATFPEIVKIMSIEANVCAIGRSTKLAPVDLEQFIVKSCSLTASIGTSGSDIIPSVLRMMASGSLDMRKIITGRYNLLKTADAIADAKGGHHGKVMVSQHY